MSRDYPFLRRPKWLESAERQDAKETQTEREAYRYRFLRENFATEILEILVDEFDAYGDPKAQLDEWCGPSVEPEKKL